MDWLTRLTVLQHWHAQSELRQRAMVRDYIAIHPGVSTSDDWVHYLAAMFGVGGLDRDDSGLDDLVH